MKTDAKRDTSSKVNKKDLKKKPTKTIKTKPLSKAANDISKKSSPKKHEKQDYKRKHNIGSRCASDRIVTYCEKGRSIYDFYAKDLTATDLSRLSNNVLANVLKRKSAVDRNKKSETDDATPAKKRRTSSKSQSKSPTRMKTEQQKKPKVAKNSDSKPKVMKPKKEENKSKSLKSGLKNSKTVIKHKSDVVKKIVDKTKKLAMKFAPRAKREASLNATAVMNLLYDYTPLKKNGDLKSQLPVLKKNAEKKSNDCEKLKSESEKKKGEKKNDSREDKMKKEKKSVRKAKKKNPAHSRELKNLLSSDDNGDMDCDVIKMLKTAFKTKKGLKKKISTADIHLGVWTHKKRMASLNAQAFLAVSSENDLAAKRTLNGKRKSRSDSFEEDEINEKSDSSCSGSNYTVQTSAAASNDTSTYTVPEDRQLTTETVGTDPIHEPGNWQKIEPWPPTVNTEIPPETKTANPGIIYWSNRGEPTAVDSRQVMTMPPKDVIRVPPRPALPNSPIGLGPASSNFTYEQQNPIIPSSHCQTYTLGGLGTLSGIPLVGYPSRSYQSAFSVPYQQPPPYYQPTPAAYFQPAGPLIQTMPPDPYIHHVPVHMQPDVKVIFHASNSTTNIQHFGSNCCSSVTCVNYPRHQCKTESIKEDISTSPIPPMLPPSQVTEKFISSKPLKTDTSDESEIDVVGCDDASHTDEVKDDAASEKSIIKVKNIGNDKSDSVSNDEVKNCDDNVMKKNLKISENQKVKKDEIEFVKKYENQLVKKCENQLVKKCEKEMVKKCEKQMVKKFEKQMVKKCENQMVKKCENKSKKIRDILQTKDMPVTNKNGFDSTVVTVTVNPVSKDVSLISFNQLDKKEAKQPDKKAREYKIFKTKGLRDQDSVISDKKTKCISVKSSTEKINSKVTLNQSHKSANSNRTLKKITVGRIVNQTKSQIVNMAQSTVKKITVKPTSKAAIKKELKKSSDQPKKHTVKLSLEQPKKHIVKLSLDQPKKHIVKLMSANPVVLPKSSSEIIIKRKNPDAKNSPVPKKKVEKIKERKRSNEVKDKPNSPPAKKKTEKIKERKKSDETKEKPSTPPAYIHGWRWVGSPEKKKVIVMGEDTPRELSCYNGIQHFDGEVINRRDCILVKSGPRKRDIPYIAKVTQFWESNEGDMMMSLLWYYRPEHTESGRLPHHLDQELFAAKHRDDTSVAVIEDKCYVLTLSQYCRYSAKLRMQQESYPLPLVCMVPPFDDKHEELPLKADPINVFICRKVYDFRQKRVLKNPS